MLVLGDALQGLYTSIGGKLGTMSGLMSGCVGFSADLVSSQAYESMEIASILGNLGIVK